MESLHQTNSPKLNVSSHPFVPGIPNFNEQQNLEPKRSLQKPTVMLEKILNQRSFEAIKKHNPESAISLQNNNLASSQEILKKMQERKQPKQVRTAEFKIELTQESLEHSNSLSVNSQLADQMLIQWENNSLNQSQFQSPLRKNRLIGSQARLFEDDEKNQDVLKIQSFCRRLIAEKPEIPDCYEGAITHYKYPISAPERDDKFVCVGNRNDFSVGWYRIGAKIDKYSEVLGSSTTNLFADREPKVFQADDHNTNLPDLSLASTEELKVQLRLFGLSEEGDRVDLFKRLVDAKESNHPRAPLRTIRRINTTALIGVLGVMTILFAAKRQYGTISPRGIWKQIRSKPPVPQQKV